MNPTDPNLPGGQPVAPPAGGVPEPTVDPAGQPTGVPGGAPAGGTGMPDPAGQPTGVPPLGEQPVPGAAPDPTAGNTGGTGTV